MTLTSGAAAANTQHLHIHKQSQSCIPGIQQEKKWKEKKDGSMKMTHKM